MTVQGPECLVNNRKQRKPRAFYKQFNIFKDYSFLHSEVYEALRNAEHSKQVSIKKLINAHDDFFGAFFLTRNGVIKEAGITTKVLVLTKTAVYCLSKELEFRWMRKTSDIAKYDSRDNELLVTFTQKAGLNGFGEIKAGGKKYLDVKTTAAIAGGQTIVLYLEDEQKARQARELLEDIKTTLLFEF